MRYAWVVSSVGQPRYVDIVKVAGFLDNITKETVLGG